MKNQIRLILSALVLAGFQAYGQNLVQNGGFETGNTADWTTGGDFLFSGVSTSFDGYTPHSGNYFLYFGSEEDYATLSQTFATTVGTDYVFSFWLAGNGTSPSSLEALWDGNEIDLVNPVPSQNYTEYTFVEAATSATSTISFDLRNDPNYDAMDDVSVTALPDAASTLGLLGAAAAGLAGLRRKLA